MVVQNKVVQFALVFVLTCPRLSQEDDWESVVDRKSKKASKNKVPQSDATQKGGVVAGPVVSLTCAQQTAHTWHALRCAYIHVNTYATYETQLPSFCFPVFLL